jgi:hypothetical protein
MPQPFIKQHSKMLIPTGRTCFFHYSIVLLMFSSAILGATIFNKLQILAELLLFVLLGYGLVKIKLTRGDLFLLVLFLIISTISVFYASFTEFALVFKIYGLCIFTFIYFKKKHFNPRKLINIVHGINILLILHQLITGHFIVASAWFFGDYKTYANDRPNGIFLVPHSSSFFIAIYIIYLLKAYQQYFKGIFFFVITLMTGSFTSTVSLLAQLAQFFSSYIGGKLKFIKLNLGTPSKIVIIAIPLLLLSVYTESFIEWLKFSSYTRYYSLEITLGQLFDYHFFADIFKVYFRDYQEYIYGQERTFADVGNEIGLIKVIVEGGIILGPVLLIILMRHLKYYSIFIFVSLLHYSFVINMPVMLFLMLHYNAVILQKQNEHSEALAPLTTTKALSGSF